MKRCKKLLALALLLALLCACALAGAQSESETVLVNVLAAGADKVECVFLQRATDAKSDAMLILVTSDTGLEVFLIDGGKATGAAYQRLLSLRKEILTAAGLDAQAKNKQYKLEITLLPTHFHSDHINELTSNILPSGMIAVKAMYCPPPTALAQDGTYDNADNVDITRRAGVLDALSRYHPGALVRTLAFGETLLVPTGAGEIRLFAPSEDWGTPENAAYAAQLYYEGRPAKVKSDMPTAVINANCMWIRASFEGASVLFTGDTMKKSPLATDEAFDRMIAFYGEALRANVVKYPHHGLQRNPACEPLLAHLLIPGENALVVLTGAEAAQHAGLVLDRAGAKWADVNAGDVAITLSAAGALRAAPAAQ